MVRIANALARALILLLPLAALLALYRYLVSNYPLASVMTGTVFLASALIALLMFRATAQRQSRRNHSYELAEIFESFAQRHRLAVNVAEHNATSYTFEAGGRLRHWLVLSAIEGDEVQMDFGDYQFRYAYRPEARAQFERLLDAWIAGHARIVVHSGGGQTLETATEGGWSEFLKTNVGPFRGKPARIIVNAG